MLNIPPYTISETMYESWKTVVYRAMEENGNFVILKALKDKLPHPHTLAEFKREFELMQNRPKGPAK